ncbi:LPS export ABC transporter periplasmic protein LptC [Putridiphycobacter roseus]|uniref:LPS export ABC transporter periplasmic protein LptC n=2 Tax=Putridiphycobacter roseus TaxID=2219161 RepID=A0A2W1N304_9FLAO|nr:LPS export ABC transporter periplasmic protein LptC [Putridiphycobacter roseus]
MFFSCENDLANVKVVTATEDTPDQIFTDFHMLYSDSGNVKIEILGDKVEDYSKFGRVTKFKSGIIVNYYSDSATLVSRLTAEYAELKPLENIIIAKNNVIITNFEKQQTLKTEELYYDKRVKKIRTDKPFYIESPNTKANGIGLTADETFSNYTMSNFSLIYTDTTDNEFSTIK